MPPRAEISADFFLRAIAIPRRNVIYYNCITGKLRTERQASGSSAADPILASHGKNRIREASAPTLRGRKRHGPPPPNASEPRGASDTPCMTGVFLEP